MNQHDRMDDNDVVVIVLCCSVVREWMIVMLLLLLLLLLFLLFGGDHGLVFGLWELVGTDGELLEFLHYDFVFVGIGGLPLVG